MAGKTESEMTKLGKILYTLFPKSIDRMIELDRMKSKSVILMAHLRWHGSGVNELKRGRALEISKELQSLRREFNTKKMWFMKKI